MRTTRTISSAFAALAIVGVSVFAGSVTSADAVAEAPVITAPAELISTDLYPTITGTIPSSGEERTITVSVENLAGSGVYCVAVVPYTETDWSCPDTVDNFGVQYGDNTFTATATDETDPGTPSVVSNSVTLTVGGEQSVSMFAPEDTQTVHDSTPLFEGFGPVLGQAHVYIGGENLLCDADIELSGYWSCSSTIELPEGGPYDIAVTASLITGDMSPEFYGPVDVYYVAPPPAPSILEPASGTSTYNDATTFSGTVPNPGGQTFRVIVYAAGDGGTEVCSAVVDDGTTWSCDATLIEGATEYYAVTYFESEGPDLSNPSLSSGSITASYLGAVPLPVMNYTLGAGSIGIVGNGVPGSELESGFYAVNPNGEGYSFNLIANCPAGGEGGEGGEEGGEGGEGGEGASNAIPGVVDAKLDFASLGPTPIGCTFSNLTPGIYNAYTYQTVDGVSSTYVDDYILIPTAPTFTATLAADGTVVFSGSGTPGYVVQVQTTDGTTVCSATVSAGENWQCSATQPPGTHSYRAVQQSTGFVADPGFPGPVGSFQGYSVYTAQVAIVVPAPPAPPTEPEVEPTPTPTPTVTPLPWTFTFSIGGSEFEPGDSTTLSGSGLPAGANVDAEFHSTPVALGSTVVEPSGSFELPVTIPEDAEPGAHRFVVTITPLVGLPSTQEQSVTVKLPVKTAASPTRSEVAAVLGLAETGEVNRNDPAAPSGLSHSIKGIGWVINNPAAVGVAAAAGLALLLLVAFPAELLNSTVSEQYPRFAKRLPRVKLTWWQRFHAWLTTTPIFGGILVTFLAAFIFGFADPGFGFDITSVRVVLACFLALFVVGYLASSISGFIIRRRWALATEIELKPLGLILAAVGVLLSRLLEFSPGFLLGLILGISLVGNTTVAQRAKATLVQAGVVFVLAMLGWVGYSLLAGGDPNSFFTALVGDTMVAITAEGLTALFIGLLPFRYLDGESVFQFSKWIWAACYTVAALAFVLIVVPSSWGEIGGSLPLWITIVAAFFIVAVGLYLYFRFWAPPIDEEDEAETSPEKVDA